MSVSEATLAGSLSAAPSIANSKDTRPWVSQQSGDLESAEVLPKSTPFAHETGVCFGAVSETLS